MPADNGFELQDTDIALLHYVFQLRIATVDHLAALSGRSVRALWGRLHKLTERRYLASVARFMQRKVYAVGPRGVSALIEQGYAPADLAERRLRHNERSEIGIRHSLFIADIHARLLLLTRDTPITVHQWIEGPSIWDTVPGTDGFPAVPIRPDSYFILKHAELPRASATSHVFLEADRSTMAHSRMAAKIQGYLSYYEHHRYDKKYPSMKSFTVATVTQTRSRAEELRRDLQPLIPHGARAAYPFIPFEDLTLASLGN
jgi:Replication-relaxation